jgi:hypothetical protein
VKRGGVGAGLQAKGLYTPDAGRSIGLLTWSPLSTSLKGEEMLPETRPVAEHDVTVDDHLVRNLANLPNQAKPI